MVTTRLAALASAHWCSLSHMQVAPGYMQQAASSRCRRGFNPDVHVATLTPSVCNSSRPASQLSWHVLLLQVKAGAEALCAFRVNANDCSKPAPAPLIGTLGKTGGHGSEVNVAHRLWSSTNRHQASWAYISKEVIQGWFEDYAEKL